MKHAALPPSDSERWVNCTASPALQAQAPEEGPRTEEQLEGDACHWLAGQALQLSRRTADFIGLCDPQGTLITEEVSELSTVSVDAINKLASATEGKEGALRYVETTTPAAPDLIHTLNWGTPDYWQWVPTLGVLDVLDEKYGYKIVHARENWQLINYAALVLAQLGVGLSEHIRVNLHIVQPRAYDAEGPHKIWSTTGGELRGYVNQLHSAANLAYTGDARTRTGTHCYKCRAASFCPAAQDAAAAAFEYVTQPITRELPGLQLGNEYAMLLAAEQALKHRKDGVEAELAGRIKRGEPTGYALDNPPGRLAWTRSDEHIIQLGDLMGVDLRKPAQPCTPTQAKARGVDEVTVRALSVRKTGGTKLVPDSKTAAFAAFSGDK